MAAVVCGWCGLFLRDDARLKSTSHGMCSDCEAKQMEELARLISARPGSAVVVAQCPSIDLVRVWVDGEEVTR